MPRTSNHIIAHLALALALACSPQEDGRTRLLAPPLAQPDNPEPPADPTEPGDDATPRATPPHTFPANDLAVALPELGRRTPYRWSDPNTFVPGHLSARLIAREGGKPVANVIIEDIDPKHLRAQRVRKTGLTFGKWPAQRAQGAWLRLLVADRFLVELRPTRDTEDPDARLDEWAALLKLDKLADLAPPPPPPAPPASAPASTPP